jgi:hypothetical protein
MALQSTGYFGNFVLVDSGGNKATVRYKLGETAVDIEAAETVAATLATRLAAVTDAVVLGYTVGEAFDEDTNFLAAAGVQIENQALVLAKILDEEEKWAQLRIPAPKIGLFMAATGKNSNIVDPADADLLTYLGSFETGQLAQVSDGEVLAETSTTGNVYGKRIHRASRKG